MLGCLQLIKIFLSPVKLCISQLKTNCSFISIMYNTFKDWHTFHTTYLNKHTKTTTTFPLILSNLTQSKRFTASWNRHVNSNIQKTYRINLFRINVKKIITNYKQKYSGLSSVDTPDRNKMVLKGLSTINLKISYT